MQEYTIQRSTRKCHIGQRAFEPDERYYSVVLQQGGQLVRHDFDKEHWQGPPENAVGWWVSRMPSKKTGKLTLAPTLVLLDTLDRLCENPNDTELAYLLAILLVRRRILANRLDEQLDEEPSHLQLVHSNTAREFSVPISVPSRDRAEQLHQQLVDLLYCET